ncbi:hypothetical protein [Levilactobacillus fujinensis]|uniref:GPP34 family phosphoprotein n=1 Tax=Levilactobacillus fujinensis TaxID=2486024 RepID=A0ABW1TK90_9LACO|nr:hypothetical protein [Levilactobacillus fujinensis]
MTLTTATNYLLLTERIGQKPTLRTRFTAQAYFVLGALLDLIDQRVLVVTGANLAIADDAQWENLPSYLAAFKMRLRNDLMQTPQLKSILKLVTSWDIANTIYDGIGAETLAAGTTARELFQNNLTPHVIYEPKDASREQAITTLKQQLQSGQVTHTTLNLLIILEQEDALKWLFGEADMAALAGRLQQVTANSAYAQMVKQLTAAASEIIVTKKFWMDGWLS